MFDIFDWKFFVRSIFWGLGFIWSLFLFGLFSFLCMFFWLVEGCSYHRRVPIFVVIIIGSICREWTLRRVGFVRFCCLWYLFFFWLFWDDLSLSCSCRLWFLGICMCLLLGILCILIHALSPLNFFAFLRILCPIFFNLFSLSLFLFNCLGGWLFGRVLSGFCRILRCRLHSKVWILWLCLFFGVFLAGHQCICRIIVGLLCSLEEFLLLCL